MLRNLIDEASIRELLNSAKNPDSPDTKHAFTVLGGLGWGAGTISGAAVKDVSSTIDAWNAGNWLDRALLVADKLNPVGALGRSVGEALGTMIVEGPSTFYDRVSTRVATTVENDLNNWWNHSSGRWTWDAGYDYGQTFTGRITADLLVSFGIGTVAAFENVPARAAGSVVGRFTPINPGPLAEATAVNFRSATYVEKVATSPIELYRVYGGAAKELGNYWTPIAPRGYLQSIFDSALLPEWGNTAKNIVKIEIPKGTKYYEGIVAPQKYLTGGGIQVVFPPGFRVPIEWIKK